MTDTKTVTSESMYKPPFLQNRIRGLCQCLVHLCLQLGSTMNLARRIARGEGHILYTRHVNWPSPKEVAQHLLAFCWISCYNLHIFSQATNLSEVIPLPLAMFLSVFSPLKYFHMHVQFLIIFFSDCVLFYLTKMDPCSLSHTPSVLLVCSSISSLPALV